MTSPGTITVVALRELAWINVGAVRTVPDSSRMQALISNGYLALYTGTDAPVAPGSGVATFKARIRAALAGSTVDTFDLFYLSDSNGQGAGALILAARTQSQLQALLRREFGVTGADFPYLPAVPRLSTAPTTTTGTVTAAGGFGVGGNARLFQSAGSTTHTFKGTRAAIEWVPGTAGTWYYRVDGAAAVNVDASSGSGVVVLTLAAGTHTIEYGWVSGLAVVGGLATWDGDLSAGIRVWDLARSGATTANAVDDAPNSKLGLTRLNVKPDALVVALGSNDALLAQQQGVAIPTYVAAAKAKLVALIATYRQLNADVPIPVVIVMYAQPPVSAASWQALVSAYREVAAADPAAIFLNMGELMPACPIDANPANPTSLGLCVDNVHLSNRGHRFSAGVQADAILRG